MNNKIRELFNIEKPIIGMMHLAGEGIDEKINRAFTELDIFQEEGINGIIVENYHASPSDVERVLEEINTYSPNLVLGINILGDSTKAFELADKFKAGFIQIDNIQTNGLDLTEYNSLRKSYPQIAVLGGVGFKYTLQTGNPLKQDLEEAKPRCEAIVTTGEGTGIETPLEKLVEYKKELGDYPLIVGTGVNLENAYDQLNIADGAIIGTYLKSDENTNLPTERRRVRDVMNVVKAVRGI